MVERARALRILKFCFECLLAGRAELGRLRWFAWNKHWEACFGGAGHAIAMKVQAVQEIKLRIVFQMLHMAMLNRQASGEEEVPRLRERGTGLHASRSKLNGEIAQREMALSVADHIEADGIPIGRVAAIGADLLLCRRLRDWQKGGKEGRSRKQTKVFHTGVHRDPLNIRSLTHTPIAVKTERCQTYWQLSR